MILYRFFERRLAQASYLIGCEQSRKAVMIDPNRDLDRYIQTADDFGLEIAYVTETHIHADFLSGAKALAERTGARLHLSAMGPEGQGYEIADGSDHSWLRDGDLLEFGTVRLAALHTPGHSPEHLTFLVSDLAKGEHPIAAVTGDFIFVGDVGRPDLQDLTSLMHGSLERSARELRRSIDRFLELPDFVQVWPGHGAGSACGRQLSAMPSSTVGYERLYNPALQPRSDAEFIIDIGEGQPDVPPYFTEMKERNRRGGADTLIPTLRLIPAEVLEQVQANDALLIDLRGPDRFAAGHLSGSLNLPLVDGFTTWAGSVVPYDRDIVLLGESQDDVVDAARELALIGMDRVEGGIVLPDAELQRDGGSGPETVTAQRIDTAEVKRLLKEGNVVVADVRATSEWEVGHIPNARHIPLGQLRDEAPVLPHEAPLIVHCESGYRSSVAASLLRQLGLKNVLDYHEGYPAWAAAEGEE